MTILGIKTKEDFFNTIHQIPYWVKNEKDMKTYASHLNFRLEQKNAFYHWCKSNIEFTEEQAKEISKFMDYYEFLYNNESCFNEGTSQASGEKYQQYIQMYHDMVESELKKDDLAFGIHKPV